MVMLANGEVEQLPGPDAGLGLIMFDMPNRFDVYLHDTPDKYIFNRDNRRISHGCIRVQDPRQFAALLMQEPIDAINQGIAMGNTTIIVPSPQSPLSATDCYQVFETSDLPAGVVNIVTGDREALCQVLADHEDVDALWYFGTAEGSQRVEFASASNMKRTWVNYGRWRNWQDRVEGEGQEFLRQATQVKNIWIPYGE